MRSLGIFIRHNIKTALFAVFVFVLFWQTYEVYSRVRFESIAVEKLLDKEKELFESSLSRKDHLKVRDTLWAIKPPVVKRISFQASREIDQDFSNIVVGEMNESFSLLKRSFKLRSSGLELGEVQVFFDIKDLFLIVLGENLILYFLIGTFFCLILFLSNFRSLQNLGFLEETLFEISEKNSLSGVELLSKKITIENQNGIGHSYIETIKKIIGKIEDRLVLGQQVAVSESKYQLARQFAHDIKSPVNTLRVFSDKFFDRSQRFESETFKTALERVESAAHHIRFLNNNTIEDQRSLEKMSLSPVLNKIIDVKKAEYENEEGVEFIYETRLVDDIMTNLPLDSLFNILSNIINNSFDAIEARGFVRVTSYAEGESLILEVLDSGHGIPAEVLPKIWNLGFSYGKRKGSGLGLGHTKKVVEGVWDGKCRAESSKSGTLVRLEIPLV